jgi:cytochrome oxidase Cu insertion factor (SCO1/SenC/PrrC family)
MFWKQLPRLWLTSASRLNNFRSVNTNPVRCMNEGPLQRPTGLSGGKKFDDDPTKGRGPVSWINLAVTGAAVAVMIGTYVYVRDTKRAELDKERKREIGKSKIGGTFLLNDQYGKPCGTKDLLGKWVLLYFGFTHCPDICPDEMEKMATVYDNIKAAGAKEKNVGDIVPVFITVDPERDTVSTR